MNFNGVSTIVKSDQIITSPSAVVVGQLARFSNTDGKTLDSATLNVNASGVLSGLTGVLGSITTDQTTFGASDIVSKTYTDTAISNASTNLLNIGAGANVFKSLNGVNNELRSMTSDTKLSLTENANNISFTVNESNLIHDSLSGSGGNTHSQIDNFISSKAQSSGLASLGANGKVPLTQISLSNLMYCGTWDVATNPTQPTGTINSGCYWIVNVSGSSTLTETPAITWNIGNWAIYNGTDWDRIQNADSVSTVAGMTGVVNLTTSDLTDITITSLATNNVLQYNGSNWVNETISGSGIASITYVDGLTTTNNNNILTNDAEILALQNTTEFQSVVANETNFTTPLLLDNTFENPIMTSNNLPSGFVATSSSPLFAAYEKYRAFDKEIITGFFYLGTGFDGSFNYDATAGHPVKSGVPPGQWLIQEFDTNKPINQYIYTTRYNNLQGAAVDFDIIYSLNGTDYFIADSQVGLTTVLNQVHTFSITPITCKYIGMNVYKANHTFFGVQDLTFKGTKIDPVLRSLGDINMTTNKILNVGNPTDDTDATNKLYVDTKTNFTNDWLIPTLSSISDQGYTITANENAAGSWYVFDNTINSWGVGGNTIFNVASPFEYINTASVQKLGTSNLGAWLVIEFPIIRHISSYDLQFAYSHIAAVEWEIIYSYDGTNYLVADAKTSQTLTDAVQTHSFTTTSAKYWGINISKVTNQNQFYIRSLNFNENEDIDISDIISLKNKTANQTATLTDTTFTQKILPNANGTIDLGSSTLNFKDLHANSVQTDKVSGLLNPVNPLDGVNQQSITGSVTPVMTSDSQDGYIATASSIWDPALFSLHGPYNNKPYEGQQTIQSNGNLIGSNFNWSWTSGDGSFNTTTHVAVNTILKFGLNIAQEWHQLELPQSVSMKSFKHKARGDTAFVYFPRDFQLFTSLDGITWTLLLTVTDLVQTSVGQEDEWQINGTGKYIGISITKNQGASAVSLGEIFVRGDSFVKDYVDANRLTRWVNPYFSGFRNDGYHITSNGSNTTDFWKVFDGLTSTTVSSSGFNLSGFRTSSTNDKTGVSAGRWFIISLPDVLSITGYQITSGATLPPKSWEFIYSLDGTTYYAADDKNNIVFTANEIKTYTVNPVSAKYVGVNVYKATNTTFQINDITISGFSNTATEAYSRGLMGRLNVYLKADLPANAYLGQMVYVTDTSALPVPCFYDGSVWKRVDELSAP
jgi:YHS domain-containing protein